MIEILHITSNLGIRSGIASVLINYYRNIDRSKVHFSIVYFDDRDENYVSEFKEMGANLIKLKRETLFSDWNNFCRSNFGKFDIFHIHEVYLSIMFYDIKHRLGVKKVITHAHVTKFAETKAKAIRNRICSYPSLFFSDLFLACSLDAGIALFGKSFQQKGIILNNAIDLSLFKRNYAVRNEKRRLYKIEDKFVIGHMGNMTPQKNHDFLIDIFHEITKKKENSILVLIGDGYLRTEIQNKIRKYGLTEKVIFIGLVSDPWNYIQMFDVFVFPSIFEGLGIALVEAQACGVPCVYSSEVPSEANVIKSSNTVMDLTYPPNKWAEETLNVRKISFDTSELMTNAGFDIRSAANKLLVIYNKILED